MPSDAGQMAALRPTAVPIHDDRNVLWKAVRVKRREQALFLAVCWFQRVRCFQAFFLGNSTEPLGAGGAALGLSKTNIPFHRAQQAGSDDCYDVTRPFASSTDRSGAMFHRVVHRPVWLRARQAGNSAGGEDADVK